MNSIGLPLKTGDFVESWLVRIWNHGFFVFFCSQDSFSKTRLFKEQKFIDLDLKRVYLGVFITHDAVNFQNLFIQFPQYYFGYTFASVFYDGVPAEEAI